VTFKKLAIIQSNYIPWKGYFDIINMVDEFILLDDVQYTRRDWRNRNMIKTSNGLQWLTIPVNVKDNYHALINEVTIADKQWPVKHWAAIKQNYLKAAHFKEYKDYFEELFLTTGEAYLSQVNYRFIKAINKILGINTKISFSTEYGAPTGKNERLIELCKLSGATHYISGPAAKDYLQEALFNQQQIQVTWMDYSGYRPYQQLYPPFEHGVTVLDLIFNVGPAAGNYMKSFTLV
jgi:hypothetical protein